MRIAKSFLPIFTVIVLLAGCGGSKEVAKPGASDIPDWYTTPPSDPNFLFARPYKKHNAGAHKKFDEEVGTGNDTQLLSQFTSASKQVTSNVLTGSKVKSQKVAREGNGYRAYVLMQLPVGAAADQLLQSMKKNDKTYTRFRATETFKELDDEAKKYEEFKKSEGQ